MLMFPQLHDGVSSISRMFYGAISDFFAQSVISLSWTSKPRSIQ
jgi:hypothetical protein